MREHTSALQPALWALTTFAPTSETAPIGHKRPSVMDFLSRLLHKYSCNSLRWTTEQGFFKLALGSTSQCTMPKFPISAQAAKHPLLVIGAGANRKMTSNMLRQLVDSTGLPFCDTQMGKGVIDSRAQPLSSALVTKFNASAGFGFLLWTCAGACACLWF